MSQKQRFKTLLKQHEKLHLDKAKKLGINNPRQQVYFLRKDGERIVNVDRRTYKLL